MPLETFANLPAAAQTANSPAAQAATQAASQMTSQEVIAALYVFALAAFLGYLVISKVPPLLHTPLDPALDELGEREKRFKANRSLRDVEPSVNLYVRSLVHRDMVEEDGEDD